MIADGTTLTGTLTGRHVPLPGRTVIRQSARPTGLDWSRHTAGPDPDAIERLVAAGLLTVTPETVDTDEGVKKVKVVRKAKGRRLSLDTMGNRRVEIDEAALAAGYRTGKTLTELAREFGVAKSTVRLRLRFLGVELRHAHRGEPVPIEHIIGMHERGLSQAQIAQRVGLTASTVSARLRGAGIFVGLQTVTFDVDKALEMAQSGLSTYEIGERMGVSRKAIARHLKRRGHVFSHGGNQIRTDTARVVELAAKGLSKAAIAREMNIAARTVSYHLSLAEQQAS